MKFTLNEEQEKLIQDYRTFVNRPVDLVWRECTWAKNEREPEDAKRAGIREHLRKLRLDGLAVLRYSPPYNRLLPIRPLIISSLDCLSNSLDREDSPNRELDYFSMWASDPNPARMDIGQPGQGFLATFVDGYYGQLIKTFIEAHDLHEIDESIWVEHVMSFLVPRGYSALLNSFDPALWFRRRNGAWLSHKGVQYELVAPENEPVAQVDREMRCLTSIICEIVNHRCPFCKHTDSVSRLDEITSDSHWDVTRFRRLVDRIPWWISDSEWNGEGKRQGIYYLLSRIIEALETHVGDGFALREKLIGLAKAFRDSRGEQTEDGTDTICDVARKVAPVWPCSADVLGWGNRLGVPIVSQGELIGIMACGVRADLAKSRADITFYRELMDNLAAASEGLVLGCDRIAGDPALPLTDMHENVNIQVRAIDKRLKTVDDKPETQGNLLGEYATACALMQLFPSAIHHHNLEIYPIGDDVQEFPKSDNLVSINDCDRLIGKTLSEFYYDQKSGVVPYRRPSLAVADSDDNQGNITEHYTTWLSSLGLDGRDDDERTYTAWVMGHLWHLHTKRDGTSDAIDSKLAFIMGRGWSGSFWQKCISDIYSEVPESLRNLFFSRGQVTGDNVKPNYQPFSIWMIESIREQDTLVAPLLYPVAPIGSAKQNSDSRYMLRHCLAYSDSTIVLQRERLSVFPWAPEVRHAQNVDSYAFDFDDSDGSLQILNDAQLGSNAWVEIRNALAHHILNDEDSTLTPPKRLMAWRKFTEMLVDQLIAQPQGKAYLRTVGYQLFANLGLQTQLDDAGNTGDVLGPAYLKVYEMLGGEDAGNDVARLPNPYDHDEEKRENADEIFIGNLLINIMMWDFNYLYFFPSATGVRHPNGGIICSFDRPLSDAEFEALQRSTEELFAPTKEFEERRKVHRESRRAVLADYAKGAAHGFKNALMLAPMVLQSDNTLMQRILDCGSSGVLTPYTIGLFSQSYKNIAVASVLSSHLQLQAQLFFWVMSPDRYAEEKYDARQLARWPQAPIANVTVYSALLSLATTFSVTAEDRYKHRTTSISSSDLARAYALEAAEMKNVEDMALDEDRLNAKLHTDSLPDVSFGVSISVDTRHTGTLIGGVVRGAYEGIMTELIQNAIKAALVCPADESGVVRIILEPIVRDNGVLRSQRVIVRNSARWKEAKYLWDDVDGQKVSAYRPSGGISGLRQVYAMCESLIADSKTLSVEPPVWHESYLTLGEEDIVPIEWSICYMEACDESHKDMDY